MFCFVCDKTEFMILSFDVFQKHGVHETFYVILKTQILDDDVEFINLARLHQLASCSLNKVVSTINKTTDILGEV